MLIQKHFVKKYLSSWKEIKLKQKLKWKHASRLLNSKITFVAFLLVYPNGQDNITAASMFCTSVVQNGRQFHSSNSILLNYDRSSVCGHCSRLYQILCTQFDFYGSCRWQTTYGRTGCGILLFRFPEAKKFEQKLEF